MFDSNEIKEKKKGKGGGNTKEIKIWMVWKSKIGEEKKRCVSRIIDL